MPLGKSQPLLLILALFEHVLNRWFIDHQVWLTVVAVDLDAIPVVPLDDPVDLFTITKHDHHGRARLHLLLIVEVFRVGLLRRSDRSCRSGRSRRSCAGIGEEL